METLRNFERLLGADAADEGVLLNSWGDCVRALHQFAPQVVVSVAGTSREGNLDDVQAVKDDVGLWFNMTNLMAAYQQRLDAQRVPVTLEATTILRGIPYSIPRVFLA